MIFVNWIIGPHLIGLIFILAGMIQKRYPPKEINSLYGYRTALSMKNQQNWDEGNRYSTALIIKCGWALVVAGLVITGLLKLVMLSAQITALIKVGLMLAGAFVTVIILFRATEKHLKNKFEQNT
ncbi:SdpI family protein [Mucilaginibacter sp. AK015]|uniref:SdpI family protein n=1 Tax=Mucilaginibacter sp. AK015 TaxID=2723072 RepID=UPI001622912B|nr:SdpI family protein [Mucilaginibacter sp. AK015]MBB5396953.1 putative membrane protein [Mucilaginibacter sp. AK015]